MLEAADHWRALAQQTNVDIGLRQEGVTYLAESEKDYAKYEAWLEHARAHGLDSKMLSSAETAKLIPNLSRRYAGAIYTAQDMRAEPWVAVPALAGIAVREGATLVENCAVRGLDIEGGKVAGCHHRNGPHQGTTSGFGRWCLVLAVPATARRLCPAT